MDVRIKTTDYEITAEVSSYLDQRIAHVEKLLGEEAEGARLEVELGRDAGRPRHDENMWYAEMMVTAPGGMQVRATNRAASINAAIDDVKEEMERQVRREKQVHIRFLRKSGALAKRWMRWE